MKNKLIITGGISLILLALFHLSFWHIFNWQEELSRLSAGNSGIMQLTTVGFICLFLCLGIILILCRVEVGNTRLGQSLLLTLSFFFLVRCIAEFIFPGSSVGLAVLLFLYSLLFLLPALIKK